MHARTEITPPDWPPRTRAAHVLVIDASAGTASAVQSVLEAAGYRVTVATTGSAGLRSLQRAAYDLVVLDTALPDMAAEDVLPGLRRQRVPVLVMSATRTLADLRSTPPFERMVGLAKPFGAVELLARVRTLLEP